MATLATNPLRHTRESAAIFLLLAFAYAYFFHDPLSNGNSRLGLVFAVVHESRLTIDTFHDLHGQTATTDKSMTRATITRTKRSARRSWVRPSICRSSAGSGCLDCRTSALAASSIYLVERFLSDSRSAAYLATIAIALGTMSFPYSTLFYGHQLAASLLFLAFFLLFRARIEARRTQRQAIAGGLLL